MSSTTERVGLTTVTGGYMLIEFPESIAPIGGVIVHPPFAYWTTARGEAKHIDIQQGFAETMATSFGSSLRPGDVLDR